ncbi:replication factor A protein 2 [Podila epigama]|nr:replication factor A protein 2 [Podila epigama]
MSGYQHSGQGFMQDPINSEHGGGVKASSVNHTLRPVTIKQLLNSSQTMADGDFRVDGVSLGQITFIGCIRNVNRQSTHHTFTIEDGTGSINAKRFPSEDDDRSEMAAIDVGSYVRVVGLLKQFNNETLVNIHTIRLIQDMNELTYHNLEVTAAHVSATRSKSGNAHMNTAAHSFGGNYNSGNTMVNHGSSEQNDSMASKALDFIRNHPDAADGVHRDAVIAHFGASRKQDVERLLTFLIDDGHLYTGMDENHVLAVDL